jgi:hypothetical protein
MRRTGWICACAGVAGLLACGGGAGGEAETGLSVGTGDASAGLTGETGSPPPTTGETGDTSAGEGPTSDPTSATNPPVTTTVEPETTVDLDTSAADTAETAEPETTEPETTEPETTVDPDTGEPGACGSLAGLIPGDVFAEMFPNANALYSYDNFLGAAAEYPAFADAGTPEQCRQEVAAFLANISHETTGGWPDAPGGPYAWGLYFTQEVGCEMGDCVGYCDPNNVQYPCAPGKTYHGRGPIQLSWNYNYGAAGEAIGEPLLAQPELVAQDGEIAFRTALWFWMTAQAPKPSAHDVMTGGWMPSADDEMKGRVPGFGMTINIINGGLECGQPTNAKVEDRVGFYQRYADLLAVGVGDNLYCDSMQPYF